ncbi:glycosyltransferase 28 [Amanita rubescens]|nr:glycosyltransferase 28 [Amanita rubescens]
MSVLVTVGSTGFDLLVQAVISDAFLDAIRRKGFVRLTVQCGNSRTSIDIELWRYKPSIQAEMRKSDIIISHAGSGTILEALRLHKPLIVVPNPTLLDDHQQEVAQALEALGHLKSSTVCDLAKSIDAFNREEIVPFPQFDDSKFARIVDDEMGFL